MSACKHCGGVDNWHHDLTECVALLRQKLAASERELADVRALDALARRHGTQLDIPSEIPGFDLVDLHFVLMPIGARSRRAAVEYLATKLGLLNKEGG